MPNKRRGGSKQYPVLLKRMIYSPETFLVRIPKLSNTANNCSEQFQSLLSEQLHSSEQLNKIKFFGSD